MLKQAYNPLSLGPAFPLRPDNATRLAMNAHRAKMGAVTLSFDPAFGNGDTPHYGL